MFSVYAWNTVDSDDERFPEERSTPVVDLCKRTLCYVNRAAGTREPSIQRRQCFPNFYVMAQMPIFGSPTLRHNSACKLDHKRQQMYRVAQKSKPPPICQKSH